MASYGSTERGCAHCFKLIVCHVTFLIFNLSDVDKGIKYLTLNYGTVFICKNISLLGIVPMLCSESTCPWNQSRPAFISISPVSLQ